MILARCPACATVFRASPNQLKLRDGLVRCGRCRTAFNALSHVVPTPPQDGDAAAPSESTVSDNRKQTPETSAAPQEQLRLAPIASAEAIQQRDLPEEDEEELSAIAVPAPEAAEKSDEDATMDATQSTPSTSSAEPPLQAGIQAETPEFAHAEVRPEAENDAPPRPILPPQDGTPVVALAEPADTRDEHAPEVTADVVDDGAQAQEHGARRLMLAWGSGLVLALVLALIQLLYLYRSDISRASPTFRPLVVSLCETLHCRIELPQQAELISIEASDLQPDPQHKDRLVLAATLKNRAGFAQSYPHVELTLTDARDQALARRVFAPDVYLPAKSKADTGFAANAEQTVRLLIDATGVGATGYRLYVFYP